eukprot:s1928_g13.t1
MSIPAYPLLWTGKTQLLSLLCIGSACMLIVTTLDLRDQNFVPPFWHGHGEFIQKPLAPPWLPWPLPAGERLSKAAVQKHPKKLLRWRPMIKENGRALFRSTIFPPWQPGDCHVAMGSAMRRAAVSGSVVPPAGTEAASSLSSQHQGFTMILSYSVPVSQV